MIYWHTILLSVVQRLANSINPIPEGRRDNNIAFILNSPAFAETYIQRRKNEVTLYCVNEQKHIISLCHAPAEQVFAK